MKKRIVLAVLIIAVIGILWGIYYYNYGNWVVLNTGGAASHDYDDAGDHTYIIDDEETAITIGSAILKDYFPDSYKRLENDIVAKRENGVWTVYNEVKTSKSQLRKYSFYGGVLYVQFKENGEIIRVGVDD